MQGMHTLLKLRLTGHVTKMLMNGYQKSILWRNHVIFVMIHCTERWRKFAPDRILSKGKQHFLSVFSVFIQRVIYHFPAHIYPDLMIPG